MTTAPKALESAGLTRPYRAFLIIMLAATTLLAAPWALRPAAAFPTPASTPYQWELSFTPGDFRLYMDPGDGRGYWYFTYEIRNDTERDQVWAPTLVLYTDVGEILPAGSGVPARIEAAIVDLLGNELLETQSEIIGDLRQGREQARDGLVVWPARDLTANQISMFIGGLSGETARIMNPITREKVILRKTLQRDYLIRGDAVPRGSTPIELVDTRWVLR